MATTKVHFPAGSIPLLCVLLLVGETQAALISLDFNAQSAVTPFPISPTMSGDEVAS